MPPPCASASGRAVAETRPSSLGLTSPTNRSMVSSSNGAGASKKMCRKPRSTNGTSDSAISSARPDRRRLAVARMARPVAGVDPPRLGRVVADDHQPQAERALDLGLVAADLAAPAPQDLVLVARRTRCRRRCSTRRRTRRPCRSVFFSPSPPIRIGEPCSGPGGGSLRTSQRVIDAGRARVAGLAVEHRRASARPPRPASRAARRSPSPELDPERLVLALEPGAADAEDRPSAAHVVERGDHLAPSRAGLRKRVRADHQAEPSRARSRRPSRRGSGSPRRSGRASRPGSDRGGPTSTASRSRARRLVARRAGARANRSAGPMAGRPP